MKNRAGTSKWRLPGLRNPQLSGKLTSPSSYNQRGESVPIRGREAILEFFNRILPAVRSLKFLHYYIGDGGWVAGQAEIGPSNGNMLDELCT